MSKKSMICACDDAMKATDAANGANDHASHSQAASLHRIAAEHCKLEGEDAMHEKHKAMAVDHDLCGSRCKAKDANKVVAPEPTPEEVKARQEAADKCECGTAIKPGDEACSKCGKPINKIEADNAMDAKTVVVAKANELSAKRMGSKQPLMASLAEAGWSLNDLQGELAEHVRDLPICKPTGDAATPCGPCGWVCDVICPSEEVGEVWQAVFQGADGHLYAVDFKVGEDVEIVGEPREVERSTDYDYVEEIANEAKASAVVKQPLEAASESDRAVKKAATATDATNAAHAASSAASDKDSHKAAAQAHCDACDAHFDAMKNHVKAGSPDKVIQSHVDAMGQHKAKMKEHDEQAEKAEASEAADTLSAKVHRCLEGLKANGANPTLRELRSEVFRVHKLAIGDDECASALAGKV